MNNSTVIRGFFYAGFIEESRCHDISSVNKNKIFLSAKADDQGIPIGKSSDSVLDAIDKRSQVIQQLQTGHQNLRLV